jgi:hypothetical protein
MSQFDELYKALSGSNPTPPKPKPLGLAGFLQAAQPKLPPTPGFVRLAKAQPKPMVRLMKPKVFVSFDFENDRRYKLLLEAWSANSRFQFVFQDKTPTEIMTESVARVKGVLSTKVQDATHVLVLCGQYVNQRHRDSAEIGCINWINFECQQAIKYNKRIVAVSLQNPAYLPQTVPSGRAIGVGSFNERDIIAALAS